MEDCSPKPKADRRYGSKIDPYAHLVDEWLEAEDGLLPRKQRHTIGACTTVCWGRITTASIRPRCVTCTGGARRTAGRAGSRGVRAARVGGGQHAGRFRRGPGPGSLARWRTCIAWWSRWCSNMRLCVALPGENAECLCHGLMLVFEHMGVFLP